MEHTGDRLKVIFKVSPRCKMWFAFHPGVNTSYNSISFLHRVKFRPTRCNRALIEKGFPVACGFQKLSEISHLSHTIRSGL